MKIGIAGAGLLGRLIALQFVAQFNAEVTLFERNASNKNSAAYVAAGLLSPLGEIEKADQRIVDLGVKSLKRWPQILKNTDYSTVFQQRGSIVTAHPQDSSELQRWVTLLQQRLPQYNIQPLPQHLEAELALTHGFYLPDEAHIDTQLLLEKMQHSLLQQQVVWRSNEIVTDMKPYCITSNAKAYRFDMVIDCRGFMGKQHFSDLRGVRGEIIYLHAPQINITRPIRLLHPRYPIYLVPRENNVYVLGASEIETEDDSPISVRTTLELLSALYSMIPAFAEARIIETAVGIRPALNDNMPRIIHNKSFIAINGLYRHGYLIAPAMVDEVVQKFQQLRGE